MPTRSQNRQDEYLGYRIDIVGGYAGHFPGLCAGVIVTDSNGKQVCRLVELLDSVLVGTLSGSPSDDDGATSWVMDRARHRVRGAILLDELTALQDGRFVIPIESQFAVRSDGYLRRRILNAFTHVYRSAPSQRGRIDFDDIGVALVENVDPKEVEYVLERLEGDGLIKPFAQGHKPGARRYIPTPEGMSVADKLTDETKAPGLLIEETVAQVEKVLSHHAPDLVGRLRAMSMRVAEAHELTHIDVGEIAQSCDLLLQDFFDLPALWQGIVDTKPPKERTKDRLTFILKARVPSQTEQELVTALFDYLFGWFGPLDKFINKHRHPTEQSGRSDAKRILLYTYLLMGDLTRLLDM